jgi:hypothetical protein
MGLCIIRPQSTIKSFLAKILPGDNTMQNANAYLIKRVQQILRVTELNPKDLSLDMLMTAFASVYEHGEAGNDQRITMKVPALATHYATLLCQGKFVVINDPEYNKWYFVKAHGADLIAVYYSIGPWLNVYGIKCTSEDALRELNITSMNTVDLRLIDNIFGFRPFTPDDEDHTPAMAVVVPQESGAKWQWHSGHKPAEKKKQQDVAGSATAEVAAPAHVAEPAGVAGEVEHRVELGGSGENQMTRAFQHAGQGGQGGAQGRRDERRAQQHGGRREQDQSKSR